MRPRIEIEKIRERYFNYSVSTGYGDAIYARYGLYSLAECVHDAATALGQNFATTTIGYEGLELGEYSVPMMEHAAQLVSHRLLAQLTGQGAALQRSSLRSLEAFK